MSLTFDFPQWKIQVARNQQDSVARPAGPHEADAAIDWAADLEDLEDGGDEAPDVDTTTGDDQPSGRDGATQGPFSLSSPSYSQVEGIGGHNSHSQGAPNSARNTVAIAEEGALTVRGDSGPPPEAQLGNFRTGTPRPRPNPAAISGDSIPAEVLLLVLSELRDDVADCVRAALVCKHWMAVVTLSNELWLELRSRHLAGGTWHRPPYAGRPVLRPPPGGDHARSTMLSYKTTCTLTQVAVRFMALRKGFEYVVEAAASLWLAARRAAAGQQPAAAASGTGGGQGGGADAASAFPHGLESAVTSPGPAAHTVPTAQQTNSTNPGGSDEPWGVTALSPQDFPGSRADSGCQGCTEGTAMIVNATGGGGGVGGSGASGGSGKRSRRITHVDQLWESCGRSKAALQVDERFNAVRVQQMVGKLCAAGASQWLPLYEGAAAVMASRCDELRDELAAQAMLAAAARAAEAAVTRTPADPGLFSHEQARGAKDRHDCGEPATSYRLLDAADAGPCTVDGSKHGGAGGSAAGSQARTRGRGPGPVQFRGEVVYGGNSYADQFAELLRRGDTRGALALGSACRRNGGSSAGDMGRCGGGSARGAPVAADGDSAGRGAADGGGGGGGDGLQGELDEPEMRELELGDVLGHYGAEYPAATTPADASALMCAVPPAGVEEGLLLWRSLLRAWAVYRRWLEVLVVWCGPLGARVEAERQLAGAAAPHGEAPLAPPHLTNKGLMLFRSQVLLAYPLRRPLQAAGLWLAARAAQAEEGHPGYTSASGCSGRGAPSSMSHHHGWLPGGPAAAGYRPGRFTGNGGGAGQGGGGDGADCDGPPHLSEEHSQLLISIRKVLTELAVPDDVTQPPHLHTRQKLQRCFGRLLLRPVPGGSRALMASQRLHAAARGGGGGATFC